MNVTVYPEAVKWLFAPPEKRAPGQECLWSFGRHPPPCDIGDDLLFRLGEVPVGRAIVRDLYKPGEYDCEKFDGSRVLTGWKVAWLQRDFEDLRALELPPCYGTPLTERAGIILIAIARVHRGIVFASTTSARHIAALERRHLAVRIGAGKAAKIILTEHGWREALRAVTDERRRDIGKGLPACRICGCTDNDACQAGCSWQEPNLCSVCHGLINKTKEAAESHGESRREERSHV